MAKVAVEARGEGSRSEGEKFILSEPHAELSLATRAIGRRSAENNKRIDAQGPKMYLGGQYGMECRDGAFSLLGPMSTTSSHFRFSETIKLIRGITFSRSSPSQNPPTKAAFRLVVSVSSSPATYMGHFGQFSSVIGESHICISGTPLHDFCSSIAAKSTHQNGDHRPKLLISFTNHGYFDMAHNFILALERLSIHNVIMFALDVPSFERLKQLNIPTWLLAKENPVYTQSSSSFGSPEFNSICNVKPWIVLECIRGGFDVVWTDTDVVWLRDAQPFFDLNPTVDLQLQGDDDDICAGYFFARSTASNVKLLETVLGYVNTWIDDQTALRRFLDEAEGLAHRITRKPDDLSMARHITWDRALDYEKRPDVSNYLVLPRSLFPNGTAYYNVKLPQRFGVLPYIVHNNCIIGHDSKVDRFKMYGQWYLPSEKDVEFTHGDETKSEEPLLSLRSHREVVTCVSIHPHHKILYSSAYDKTVNVYKFDTLVERSRESTGGGQVAPSGGAFLNRRGSAWCMAFSSPQPSSSSSSSSVPSLPSQSASTQQLASVLSLVGLKESLPPMPSTDASTPNSSQSIDSNDESILCFTGGHDRHVMVWKTNNGMDDQVFANQGPWDLLHTMKGHQGVINDVIFHRGQVFSASDDGTVRSWDANKGERTRIFRAGSGWMSCVVADGPALFACNSDGCAYAWEIATARLMQVYKGHEGWVRSLVVHSTLKRVYTSGSDGTIREWDMISGDSLRVLRNAHTSGINKLLLSAKTGVLYSCSDDCLVRAWKISDFSCVQEYRGHKGSVTCAALSEKHQLLITGSADRSVLVWRAASAQ